MSIQSGNPLMIAALNMDTCHINQTKASTFFKNNLYCLV